MHTPRLPLLLKIAAATAAGALALIVAAGLRRDDAVASLRREIRDAVAALVASNEDGVVEGEGEGEDAAEAPAPSVLITGFRAHGKSSLVNTACRALAAEEGPLLLRAEASPPGGGSDGTRKRRRVKAAVAGDSGDAGTDEAVVELLDAPPLPEATRATRADIDAAISGGNPECVVLALRCDAPAKERNAAVKRLPEISAAVRAKGLNLIVVLTFKKAMRSARQAEELIREVSFRARTDCVYFIENYTWNNNGPNLRHPPVIKNDFETHFTVLTIIRQCLEFIKLNRSQSKREENGEKGNSGDVKGTLEKVLTANAKSSGELSVKPALEKVLTANAKSSGELSVKPADVKPVLTVQ
uniref:G domain-containing protein n=1 Tax=Oryza glumipatula TaxID=40148 RepID=A0A0D9YX73_9ORYZ